MRNYYLTRMIDKSSHVSHPSGVHNELLVQLKHVTRAINSPLIVVKFLPHVTYHVPNELPNVLYHRFPGLDELVGKEADSVDGRPPNPEARGLRK